MAGKNAGLTKQEDLFCYYYARLKNPREAAARAGYPPLTREISAALLMKKPAIRQRVSALAKEEDELPKVRIGLERLAFSAASDAVKLLFLDEDTAPSDIDALDLFNVSEIKRTKGGGVEVKFFDRIKALEKLSQLEPSASASEGSQSFYRAMELGAKAIAEHTQL